MGAWLKMLTAVVSALGTKLPLVWPDLVEIAARLRHILEVAGVRLMENLGPAVSDDGAKLTQVITSQGIPHDEVHKVVASMEQFEGRFGS